MNVTRERYSQDYGCSFIGVIASVIVIVGLFVILYWSNIPYSIEPIGPSIPNTDFEIIFVPESALVPSLVLLVVIIYWLYIRRNRSAFESV
ncbi:MAG: hypothetical protein PVJ05_04715 [Candidatus Thorarchaeota archaeon]